MLVNRRAAPSGRQSGREAPVDTSVTRSASPPPAMSSTRICDSSWPSRFAEKAMRRESGLQATPVSGPAEKVICLGGALPSAGTSHRSLDLSFSS